MRAATDAAVAAIRGIREVVGGLDGVAGAIASAVEEQGAATREIAGTADRVARATGEAAAAASSVQDAVARASRAAAALKGTASSLSADGTTLRRELDAVVVGLQAG